MFPDQYQNIISITGLKILPEFGAICYINELLQQFSTKG